MSKLSPVNGLEPWDQSTDRNGLWWRIRFSELVIFELRLKQWKIDGRWQQCVASAAVSCASIQNKEHWPFVYIHVASQSCMVYILIGFFLYEINRLTFCTLNWQVFCYNPKILNWLQSLPPFPEPCVFVMLLKFILYVGVNRKEQHAVYHC